MFTSNWARLLAPALVATFSGIAANAAEYQVDTSHSKVGFTVKHMMISKVHGRFKDFEGKFNFDPAKGTVSDTTFVVKTASVDTEDAKRDEHLRSPDFFDVEKNPTMTVTNSKLTKKGKNKFKWAGDLTIKGVTKPVVFDLEYTGAANDPWGNSLAGFSAKTTIKRKDFGITWNKNLDKGGVAVGEDVEITLDIEAKEVKAAAPVAEKAADKPAEKAADASAEKAGGNAPAKK